MIVMNTKVIVIKIQYYLLKNILIKLDCIWETLKMISNNMTHGEFSYQWQLILFPVKMIMMKSV